MENLIKRPRLFATPKQTFLYQEGYMSYIPIPWREKTYPAQLKRGEKSENSALQKAVRQDLFLSLVLCPLLWGGFGKKKASSGQRLK